MNTLILVIHTCTFDTRICTLTSDRYMYMYVQVLRVLILSTKLLFWIKVADIHCKSKFVTVGATHKQTHTHTLTLTTMTR